MSFPLIIPQGAYPTYVSIFRPLAGITVFRTGIFRSSVEALMGGFRPLAGITVFRTSSSELAMLSRNEFPSPGGDYGLSDSVGATVKSAAVSSFRPLAGITVFRTLGNLPRWMPPAVGFRPLAGITVFRTRKLSV